MRGVGSLKRATDNVGLLAVALMSQRAKRGKASDATVGVGKQWRWSGVD
jgi:hypothetical protein